MPRITDDAIYCGLISTLDSYGNQVELAVYQDTGSNGLFAIDSSFIEQEEPETIPSPFNKDTDLKLIGD